MLTDYKVDISKKTQDVAEEFNKEKIYTEFVRSQEQGFIRFVNYINSVVDLLKRKAKISQFIEIRARIKDVHSALRNYDEEKLLDDVFGVEIICANENEIRTIKEELEKYLKSTRSKTHNKSNGYKAQHESYSAKRGQEDNIKKWKLDNEDVPAVECQFKTIEVELNPQASHHDYKNVDKEKVQNLLERRTLEIGRYIPKMWSSRENGIVELGYKEIIQRIYPFVDITTIKEQKEDIKMK